MIIFIQSMSKSVDHTSISPTISAQAHLAFKRQLYKMVKHTQTICRRIVWVCLTILWDWHLKG